MSSPFKGKWAVITGGSQGIGEAIAFAFAKREMCVCLTARNEDKLKIVAKKCEELGAPETKIMICDFSEKSQVDDLGEKILTEIGAPEVLVNNAGLYRPGNPIEGDCDEWDTMIQVNLLSPMRLTRKLSPKMCERMSGSVINIGSIAGVEPMSGTSGAYAAAKWGMSGWSKSSYLTFRHKNIKCCVIQPAFVNTDMVKGNFKRENMIQPKDIADYCLFILDSSPGCIPEEIVLRLGLSAMVN